MAIAAKRALNYTIVEIEVDDTPTGIVYQWAGAIANIPSGYLLCDGSSLLRSSYPSLFSAIGVIYGSADGSHFSLPDLRDKFVVGARQDNSGVPNTNVTGALTATGGAIDYSHSGAAVADHAAHTHAVGALGFSGSGATSGAGSAHTHTQGTTVVTPTTHSSQGGHTHDSHTTTSTKFGSSTGSPLTGPTTHASQGAHTHDNHGLTWGPATQNAHTHPVTAAGSITGATANPSATLTHTVTEPSDHNPVLPPYLTMAFII